MIKNFLLVSLSIISLNTSAQKWLGERTTNTSNFIDPTEIQFSGSLTALLDKDMLENQFLPFSIGGSKSIYSSVDKKDRPWEIYGELGSFTQFLWQKVDEEHQRNLFNVDYKVAFSWAKTLKKHKTIRLRFFHVSSHLGDDYIFRNRITSHTTNKVNYEQLDLTYFNHIKEKIRYNVNIGSVIRPGSPRLPFSYQVSFEKMRNENKKNWQLSYAANLKGMQETKFDLNLKLALGFANYSVLDKPFRIVAEYYTGHMPYSQMEINKVSWIGLGIYFTI